jgi:hypothetical protein
MTSEVQQNNGWMEEAPHIKTNPLKISHKSIQGKITDLIYEADDDPPDKSTKKPNIYEGLLDLKILNENFKRVKFRGPGIQKSNLEKSKPSRDWRKYIDGTYRLNDDLDYINMKNSQTSSLFYKAPTRDIKTTFVKKRIKKRKPFTQPYQGQSPQKKIKGSENKFSSLPNQNEINKMLT